MARDNFSKATIDRLAKRVSFRCSNPDCRVPTSGPNENPDKITNIGVAAHINAASPGGPRFDASMSQSERKNIKNGIWLCAHCAKKIDDDPVFYTQCKIVRWKETAESSARNEIGKRLPKTSDSTDLLAAAFSGMPLNKIGNAIKNVHTAQEKFLSSLDPRFSVTSEYYEDATKYRLDAVEKGFGINFKFNFKDRPDLRDDLRGFYRQGRPVSIPSELVEVEGSNLFEHIFSEQGELNIVPQGHSAKLKMWLAGNDVDDFFQIDDLDGHVYIGSEEAMFRGECFGGLLSVEHSNISRQLQGALNYTLSLDITKWDHVELLKLPYFNKLKELVEKIVDGWNVLFSLEIKGDVVYKSNPVVISGDEYWRAALDHFNYISSAKTISSLLGVDIAHDSNYVCAGLSALKVKEVADIISGSKAVKFSDLTDFPELSLTVDSPDEVKKVFGNQQGPQEIVSEIAGKSIEIFGRKISLPKEVCRFKGVGLSFSKPLDLLEIGDRIQIVLKPMLPDQEFERYFLGYE